MSGTGHQSNPATTSPPLVNFLHVLLLTPVGPLRYLMGSFLSPPFSIIKQQRPHTNAFSCRLIVFVSGCLSAGTDVPSLTLSRCMLPGASSPTAAQHLQSPGLLQHSLYKSVCGIENVHKQGGYKAVPWLRRAGVCAAVQCVYCRQVKQGRQSQRQQSAVSSSPDLIGGAVNKNILTLKLNNMHVCFGCLLVHI